MDGSLFPVSATSPIPPHNQMVALDEAVSAMLSRDCVVAVGISGGKDSVACALAVNDQLNVIGHSGPRLLIHADLGMVEWADSLPACERLAARIGWELVVVKRAAGGLMERWESRWAANLSRYVNLECVKVILPWSTPGMRFCTSELKTEVICRALKRRFKGMEILNVLGVRRQESIARSKKPISAPNPKLLLPGVVGLDWNAIIDWTVDDVFARIAEAGLKLHEAYIDYGSSRVSCAFCIMSSLSDLKAAASSIGNRDTYIRMVELEAASTFAFQGSRWLADVAPELLSASHLAAITEAKDRAKRREALEAKIPAHLLYSKGWPTSVPTREEAVELASVRTEMSRLLGVDLKYIDPDDIVGRYECLSRESGGTLLPKHETVQVKQFEMAW